jgi:ectoine hydroxylase-related dioxygenase (phytanoyl-CoA dioxygenase family)
MAPESSVEFFHEFGYAIIRDAVDSDHVAILRDRMLADVQSILARTDAPFNFNRGNIQQAPPPFEPYLFDDIVFNDTVIEITREILGGPVRNTFYSGNTALPGEHTQPVHPDTAHPVAGGPWTPTDSIVVNLMLVDVSPANGATELWPGTHRDTTYGGDTDGLVRESDLERWRRLHPPFQPTLPAGTFVLRDMRLWHRGMPNRTSNPRPMLAMIHRPAVGPAAETVEVPARSAAWFANRPIETPLAIIPDDYFDHIRHGESYGV